MINHNVLNVQFAIIPTHNLHDGFPYPNFMCAIIQFFLQWSEGNH